jgi:hypothetical protein
MTLQNPDSRPKFLQEAGEAENERGSTNEVDIPIGNVYLPPSFATVCQ